MLFEEIKKANMEALKVHDSVARAIYGVVINKIQVAGVDKRAKGEELTDADVLQILQKAVKELAEECENYAKAGNQNEVENINKQMEIVKSYLPTMMSVEEIKAEIEKLDDKSIGSVMKHFKMNFAGRVDMSEVQTVLKSM